MIITPLGCLAGMPAAGLASSGYLITAGVHRIMLDAGPGTATALTRYLDRRLDAVVISHEHTDHLFDLLVLGKMILNQRLHRTAESAELILDESIPPVPLFVPRGAEARLRTLAGLYPVATHPILDRAFDLGFIVREYEPGQTVTVGAVRLTFALLAHAAPNCGVRVEAGEHSLVYSGDTGPTPALTELASGAGTLLCECTLREADRSGHGHLSSREAGRAAHDAGVGELVLTHFADPDPAIHTWHRTQAAVEFAGPIHLAVPGTPIDVALAGAPIDTAAASTDSAFTRKVRA
jgi:ribonuclease BN (tRNA processing enzyme)